MPPPFQTLLSVRIVAYFSSSRKEGMHTSETFFPKKRGIDATPLCNKKSQATWKCAVKGCRRRPQSPRLAPAGAKSPCNIKNQEAWKCAAKGCRGRPQSPRLASAEAKPLQRKRPAAGSRIASPAGRSRPSGATMLSRSKKQLGGAPAGARSYWQGRFAACAFVERI